MPKAESRTFSCSRTSVSVKNRTIGRLNQSSWARQSCFGQQQACSIITDSGKPLLRRQSPLEH